METGMLSADLSDSVIPYLSQDNLTPYHTS